MSRWQKQGWVGCYFAHGSLYKESEDAGVRDANPANSHAHGYRTLQSMPLLLETPVVVSQDCLIAWLLRPPITPTSTGRVDRRSPLVQVACLFGIVTTPQYAAVWNHRRRLETLTFPRRRQLRWWSPSESNRPPSPCGGDALTK